MMKKEDKKRLFRSLKLSLDDLETVIGALRLLKQNYFRQGNSERFEELEALETYLKNKCLKD